MTAAPNPCRAPRVSVQAATSDSAVRAPGPSSQSASRPAAAASAASERAESSTGAATEGSSELAGRGTGAATAGASSRITCALVPLIPKADTPARRGRSPGAHSTGARSSSTAPLPQSTAPVGSSACRVAGSTPCRSACTILMMPATPAAACACPMLDFTDPSHNGRPGERSWPYVASRASASIGSPSRVPVPWASTASTSATPSPAAASAARITRSCEGPFGAVRPFEAPSWLTAVPRTTASTGWPLARASESRSTRSSPTPSEKPVPSASAEKARQRPSGESPRCRLNSIRVSGVDITVAPPTRARLHSPERRACPARCRATREEEQAVSTVTAGPSKPYV